MRIAILLVFLISIPVVFSQYCGDMTCNGIEPETCPQDCGLSNVPPPSTKGHIIPECPYFSTQAKIQRDISFLDFVLIKVNEPVRLFGFHNSLSSPATDVDILVSGPGGSFFVSNGAIFTPRFVGDYEVLVTTRGSDSLKCQDRASIRVFSQCDPHTFVPETISCGSLCGTKTKFCNSNGEFETTACVENGVCVPGSQESCWSGSRTCLSTCQWSSCNHQAACVAGSVDSQACGNCGIRYRTCSANYQWNEYGPCIEDSHCGFSCTPGTVDFASCFGGKKVRICLPSGVYSGYSDCFYDNSCNTALIDSAEDVTTVTPDLIDTREEVVATSPDLIDSREDVVSGSSGAIRFPFDG